MLRQALLTVRRDLLADARDSDIAFFQLVLLLCAVAGLALGALAFWTRPTATPMPEAFRQYENLQAAIATADALYAEVAPTPGRMRPLDEQDPKVMKMRALSKELDRLKSQLPKEPPAGYAAFLIAKEKEEDPRWNLLVGTICLIGGGLAAVVAILCFFLPKEDTDAGEPLSPSTLRPLQRAAVAVEKMARDFPDGDPKRAQWIRIASSLRAAASVRQLRDDLGADFKDVESVLKKSGVRLD